MKYDEKLTRESLAEFAAQALAPDSVPGGIIQAKRINMSEKWDEEGDVERSKRNVDSYAKVLDAASRRVARRD